MRKTLQAQATIAASPETLLGCLADYKCAELCIEGLEQLAPTGGKTAGEGAKFDAVLQLGPRTLRTTIEITKLDSGRSITWASAGDEGQSLTFDLQPEQDKTLVSLTVSYEEPGGIGGALIALFVEQTVRKRATDTLDRLREHVSPEPGQA